MEDEEPGGSRRIQRMQTQPELLTHKNDSFSIVFGINGHDLAKKIKRIIVQLSRFDCQDIKCCSNATHPFVAAARPFILSALAFKSLF